MHKRSKVVRQVHRFTCGFFLLFFLPQLLQAQQKTRLTAGWEFIREDLGSAWEAARDITHEAKEIVPAWDSVTLPHCVNAFDAVDPDVNYYQGPAWYRSLVNIQNPYANGRTLLQFEGAGQKTDVFIGTQQVGHHVGGYDEWVVDITDALAGYRKKDTAAGSSKKIPLIIRTDNSRDVQMIPSDLSDFNLYGGMYRPLNLVYVPSVYIDKVFAAADVDSSTQRGQLRVKLRLKESGENRKAQVQVTLFDPAGKPVKQTQTEMSTGESEKQVADFTLAKPALWSVDHPQLYKLIVSVKTNDASTVDTTRIGFRYFRFEKKGPFYLNGKRLLIRGTQRHEDAAGVGAAETDEQVRREMIDIKEMGANFIRLGHYQQSQLVLNLCDSLGLLVWEEIPWCRGGLGNETYKDQARRMLTNMIEQHYNHPSVIIWGLGNENDWPGDFPKFDEQEIRDFMAELNTLAHHLDGSRKTAIRRCDFCKDIPDIYSPSIWAGWYRGIYTGYRDVTKTEFNKVDHFLHMEWGGDSHAGRHSENPDKVLMNIKAGGAADERAGDAALFGGAARVSKDGDWSESYICNLFDWHLKEQETMPWLTGTAQWIFKDFSTPLRPDNPVPYVNQKGLEQRDGTRKEGYYVFQSYWSTKPMAHIYGHTWPVRWGDEGELKMVKVYSNCQTAELFVNGKSFGIKERNAADFPAAGLRWQVPFRKGENKIRVVARSGSTTVRDTISFVYQTEKWGKPALAELKKLNEKDGIVTLQVRLLDANGVLCADARNWVRFGLTGDGKLLDNLGTPSGSRKVQLANGRATIQVNTRKGHNVASANVEGVPTAFLEF